MLVIDDYGAVGAEADSVIGHGQVFGNDQEAEQAFGHGVGEHIGHQGRRQPVRNLALQGLARHVFQQLDVAHGQVITAGRIAPIEVVDRQGLGEFRVQRRQGQRQHGGQSVEHIVAAQLIGAVGQALGMGVIGRFQQQGGGVRRTRGRHDDVAAPALLALIGGADHFRDPATRGVGLQLDRLAPGQECDVGHLQQGVDRQGARVGLGLQQTGIAPACMAADAGRRQGLVLVQIDP